MASIKAYTLTVVFIFLGGGGFIPLKGEETSDFSAKAFLSDSSGSIPDPVTLSLELTYPQTYHPDIEAIISHLFSQNSPPPFRLLKESATNDHLLKFVLEPVIPGAHELALEEVIFLPSDPSLKTIKMPLKVLIYKALLPPPTSNLFGYSAPLLPLDQPLPLSMSGEIKRRVKNSSVDISKSIHDIPWIGLLGVVIAGSIWALIYFFPNTSSYSRQKTGDLTEAMKKAEQLLKTFRDPPIEDSHKAYFNQLNQAVRLYIEEKYDLNNRAMTSEEFFQKINALDLLDTQDDQLMEQFLKISDAVSFAKHIPSKKEAEKAWEIASAITKYGQEKQISRNQD